ncbi:hypothetical protein PLICRDRAFT_456583 [Plicaturopsis crispa FD-325 SS-3]|nr:hypothetical protein PLICRDRAFT_456583 [Plicaturopsis crispa FD-325 SS-3]
MLLSRSSEKNQYTRARAGCGEEHNRAQNHRVAYHSISANAQTGISPRSLGTCIRLEVRWMFATRKSGGDEERSATPMAAASMIWRKVKMDSYHQAHQMGTGRTVGSSRVQQSETCKLYLTVMPNRRGSRQRAFRDAASTRVSEFVSLVTVHSPHSIAFGCGNGRRCFGVVYQSPIYHAMGVQYGQG